MHKFLKRFPALAVLACFPLVLAACGGGSGGSGGGGGSTEMTAISGTAIKGPIKGALVRVYRLNSDGTKGELLGSGTSDGSAAYSIPIEKAKAVAPLLVTVSGQSGATYTSETTGNPVPFGSAETFRAVLDTFEPAKKVTVSPLTEAAYQQVQKFLTDSPSSVADTRVISAANARVATLFNVRDILADPAADPSYTASLKIIDRMVETSKANGATTTQQTMTLINQAVVDVTGQAYQSYRTNLTAAAAAVVAGDTSVTTVVNAIVATTATPPAKPVFTDTTAPNAVTNLKAAAAAETATASSVTLSWDAATTTGRNQVAGYHVFRDSVKIATVTATTCTDTAVSASTSYTYKVQTFDAAGNGSAFCTVTAVTPAPLQPVNISFGGSLSNDVVALPDVPDITPPTVPAILAASTKGTGGIELAWTAATDQFNRQVTYQIFRDSVKVRTTAGLLFSDTGLSEGTRYCYTVKAIDPSGNISAASALACATTATTPSGNPAVTVGGSLEPGTY